MTVAIISAYIVPVVGTLAGIAVAVGTVLLCRYARKTLLFYILADIQRTYSSAEMLAAVKAIWDFYRAHPTDFVDNYVSILQNDEKRLNSLERNKRASAISGTLHHQRRIVTQFYQHLGALSINGLIPPKVLYSIWGEEDLRIIPLILVPIENRIREQLTGAIVGPLDKKTPMIVLYSRSRTKK